MVKKRRSDCPISFSLDLFGDKWSLLILRDIMLLGKQYYGELINSDEGISTNILADRLQKLEHHNILSKKQDPSDKKKLIYQPTKKGLDLLPVLLEMGQWGAKYDPGTGAPPELLKTIRENKEGFIKKIRSKFEK